MPILNEVFVSIIVISEPFAISKGAARILSESVNFSKGVNILI